MYVMFRTRSRLPANKWYIIITANSISFTVLVSVLLVQRHCTFV